MRPILVATDFSASAEGALRLAAGIACSLGSEVLLLHVDVPPESAPLTPGARARREHARAELDRSRRIVEQHEVRAETCLRPGDPAQEILRVATAQDVAAIVLGTCAASITHALLGSVADRVVRGASQPILIVPRRDQGAGAVAV